MDKRMIDWFLCYCESVEVAAAHYDAAGKVDRVNEGKRKITSQADYDRLSPWLRHANANGCNIWVRPAMATHALIMLDDLPTAIAAAVAKKYRALAVETSENNAQAWIVCNRELTREERQDVARSLCRLIGSDPGAISEPRWGRLAGYRQKKPGKEGFMTRVIAASGNEKPPLDPMPHLHLSSDLAPSSPAPPQGAGGAGGVVPLLSGRDESRREFAFACHALRRGMSPAEVEAAIAAHVVATGRRKSRDYAARTVAAAAAALASEQAAAREDSEDLDCTP